MFALNAGWQNIPLLSILKQNFQTNISIDNEAHLAALGEQFFGSAKGFREVLYLSLGRGLGGLVLNEQIYNGATGIAGEFGHITVTLKAQNRIGRQLGIGLASLLNTLNLELIVIGGEFSAASDYLLPAARIEMEKRSLKWALKAPEMKVARFGSNAAIMRRVGKIFQSVLRSLSGLKRNGLKNKGLINTEF